MINDLFVVTAIADIHFGAIKAETLYNELKLSFLSFIKDKRIDMIVICGDYYNSIINLNSKSSHLSLLFMKNLISIAKSEGIKYIRIIEGTLSHDNNQLNNFKVFENDTEIDFKIIMNVTEEVLTEGLRILYVPEEYMENPDEYYAKYFAKKKYYDFIFGHGMFKESSFTTNDGETRISRAPIFDSKAFINMCTGPIIFGHIHIKNTIRKHIFYIGSFSRWIYGEEESKGFMVFVYHRKEKWYVYQFIENKFARLFDTIEILNLNHFTDGNKLVKFISGFKKDNLRIKVIIDDVQKNVSYMINFLREYYTNKPGYKLEIINKMISLKQQEVENKVNKLLTEYDFVFDKKLPPEFKVQKFIKKRYQKDIEVDKIKDILYNN